MSETDKSPSKGSFTVSPGDESKGNPDDTSSLVQPQQEAYGNGLLLLDEASSQMPLVAPELETQRRVATTLREM